MDHLIDFAKFFDAMNQFSASNLEITEFWTGFFQKWLKDPQVLRALECGFPADPKDLKLPKCAEFAELSRATGNGMFKKKKFELALNFYNTSLCYTPPGSKDIALAYGNRSAVYCEIGKYALAIENIKMARDNGFPPEKWPQLDAREEKCKKLMEKFGPDKKFDASSFFKLSHPPNEKIPFIAGCLELRQNEKYGRYIVTNKDLKAGDIIAIESPVFSCHNGLMFGTACSFCTRSNSKSLFPCSHCTRAMYCSEECQQKDALLHYKDDFDKTSSGFFENCSLKMQLQAFRIAGGVNELLELLKDSENKTIFDFDFSDPDDPSYAKNMLVALNGLCKNVQRHEMIEIKPEQLLNIPPINEKPRTAEERKQLLKFIISQFQIRCSNFKSLTGNIDGIYLLQSLLNHSCIPNVECFEINEELISIVVLPVKAGDQIFCSYGVNAMVTAKEERSVILQPYQFKCDCEACVKDYSVQFPRKDRHFVEPRFEKLEPAAAIQQFKKNCKYIDKNARKMPCREVVQLGIHNTFLAHCIAGSDVVINMVLSALGEVQK